VARTTRLHFAKGPRKLTDGFEADGKVFHLSDKNLGSLDKVRPTQCSAHAHPPPLIICRWSLPCCVVAEKVGNNIKKNLARHKGSPGPPPSPMSAIRQGTGGGFGWFVAGNAALFLGPNCYKLLWNSSHIPCVLLEGAVLGK
jgi:hypothetical protein